MIRHFGTGRLSQGSQEKEDVNPMEGLGNLADAMLILAVGIMLALIMHWNVDITTTELNQKQEISDVEQSTSDKVVAGDGMEEMGMVYKDPKTGKMYMVVDEGKDK